MKSGVKMKHYCEVVNEQEGREGKDQDGCHIWPNLNLAHRPMCMLMRYYGGFSLTIVVKGGVRPIYMASRVYPTIPG